jgi:hypothetical protein
VKARGIPDSSVVARTMLLIRRVMGVPSRWKWPFVGALIVAGVVWLGGCDLNPQPLPPMASTPSVNASSGGGGEDAAAFGSSGSSGSSSGGSSGSSSGGSSGTEPMNDGGASPVGADAAAADGSTDASLGFSDAGLEADGMSSGDVVGDGSDAPADGGALDGRGD